jgi:phenylacetate-CoA ligase
MKAILMRATISTSKRLYSFRSPLWDKGEYGILYSFLLSLLQQQILYAADHCPFWSTRLKPFKNQTLDEKTLAEIPFLTKNDLQIRNAMDFVATENFPFYIVRQSGGTTGTPAPLFWTKGDWHAAILAVCRFVEPLANYRPLVGWNGYNQAHVGGPSFDDVLRELGGVAVPRHFKSDDLAAIQEIERFKAKVLVLPAKSGTEKGRSIEDLLVADASFLSRIGIKAVMVSSTGLDSDVVDEMKEQGVQHIINLYGSTEAFPSAISCEKNPLTFHLCQGPNLTEVVGPDGKGVKNGELGLIVVSRIGSETDTSIFPAGGTQLLRFIVGDEATLIDEPCGCGRTSPRIANIKRVLNIQDKITGGCQKWE